jgi:hypothetical protein
MFRCNLFAIAAVAVAGCGMRGGTVVVNDPGLRGAVLDFEQAVNEAKGDVRNITNAANQETEGEENEGPSPEQSILASIQMVESAAQQLVQMAPGSPVETEARALHNEAQELLKKAQSRPSPAELIQGLDRLKSKAQEMKAKL